MDGWHRRRLLLLTALALISRGCGLGTRLLHLDELVDVLSGLLCKVNSKIALNALNAGPLGLAKLAQDVRLAERLRALHAFKLRHRKAKQVVLLCASCSSLQPYLTLLDQKRAFFESQRHRAALLRQKQFETQMAAQKSKNAHLAAHLASLQDGSKQAFLAPYLHAWRCLLNFRLVRARTRRRFKVAIITRWRRSCRVGQIAGIFYGKKLKLRAFNSWFSKRFGLNRERALTT